MKDTLFDTNGNLIVLNLIKIRQSHNAFLQVKKICKLRNKNIDISENSSKIIERNVANDLIWILQKSNEFVINKSRFNR